MNWERLERRTSRVWWREDRLIVGLDASVTKNGGEGNLLRKADLEERLNVEGFVLWKGMCDSCFIDQRMTDDDEG